MHIKTVNIKTVNNCTEILDGRCNQIADGTEYRCLAFFEHLIK